MERNKMEYLALIFSLGLVLAGIQFCMKSNEDCRKMEEQKREEDKLKENEAIIEKTLGAKGFKVSRIYTNIFGGGIAADRLNKRICFLRGYAIYGFLDIIGCEIYVKEGEAVSKIDVGTKTARGSQLGGAVVGGLIAGPAGLVVGGLSGGKNTTGLVTTTKRITEVVLHVTVRDARHPIHSISFINSMKDWNSHDYTAELNTAREWQAFLTVVMKEREAETANIAVKSTSEQDRDSGIVIEICRNCDRKIGKLETAYVFNNHIVCQECYQKLSG